LPWFLPGCQESTTLPEETLHFEKFAAEGVATDHASTGGVSWVDFDKDGDLDAVVANWGAGPGVYLNSGQGEFERAPFGCLGKDIWYIGAIASGDFDSDGNMDVFVGSWPNNPGPGERSLLFRNEGNDRHWLGVRLTGRAGNPGGIGARVQVTSAAGTQIREITTQMGFRGQSDMAPHFGLGENDHAVRVEIKWPSGKVSNLENVAANQIIEVVEPGPTP